MARGHGGLVGARRTSHTEMTPSRIALSLHVVVSNIASDPRSGLCGAGGVVVTDRNEMGVLREGG